MAVRASNAPPVTRRAQRRLGIVLVLPVAVMIVVFFLLPMANALVYSVVDFDGISPNPPFIGAANFIEMFTDPGGVARAEEQRDLDRRSAPRSRW